MRKLKPPLIAVIGAIFLAAALAASGVPVLANGVAVSIDGPDEVAEGSDFIASIDITYVEKFAAAEFVVTFDSTILAVTDVTDGELDGSVIHVDGYTTPWDGDPDKMKVLVSWATLVPGVDGEGYLADMHFHVIGISCQTSAIDLSQGKIANGEGLPIEATWQGDSVHVTASQESGGGGAGGSPAPTPKLKLEVMGKVFSVPVTKAGVLEEALEACSPDGAVTLRFAEGTRLLDSEGNRLEEITVYPVPDPPRPPGGAHMIGLAYDFGPEGATFDHEIELIISYDPELLSDGVSEEDLVMAYYNSDSEGWVLLPSRIDTGAHTVTASIGHFTIFAIIGTTVPIFTLSNLSISPSTVDPGESVAITLEVRNTGGLEGSYAARLVIDGVEEATQELTLAPGAVDAITFNVKRDAEGNYSVEIDGKTGEFTVTATAPSFPWALFAGTLGGILAALAGAVALHFVLRRRRMAAA